MRASPENPAAIRRVVSQFEIAPTDGGQRDREADPARGGSYSQGKLFDLATTPAPITRWATPSVPVEEPEFQTETPPARVLEESAGTLKLQANEFSDVSSMTSRSSEGLREMVNVLADRSKRNDQR